MTYAIIIETVRSNVDIADYLLSFGPLGIFVFLYVTDFIPSRKQLSDQKERFQEQLKEQKERFLEQLEDKDETIAKQDATISILLRQGQQTLPVLHRTAEVMEATKVPAELEELREVLPMLSEILERVKAEGTHES